VGIEACALEKLALNVNLRNAYRGRRVLVTGHTGFKGGWLCLWLSRLEAEVTGYALPPVTKPNLYTVAGLETRIRSVIGDVRDEAAVRQAVADARPEIIFHLAAQALVDVSYRDPRGTFEVNVSGTAGVLDAALGTNDLRAALVVTSDKCYESQGWPWGYRETDALGGHDPYSASKACEELVVASYRRSFFGPRGLGLATARAGNVIGGGDFTPGRLVPDCLRAFAERCPVRLRYPDAVRPWQHVLEPLSGYLLLGARLLEDPPAWSEPFNFGPDPADALPVRELVAMCAAAWGEDATWEQEPGEHLFESGDLRVDASKARQRLGWRPRWRLPEALTLIVDWQKNLLAGNDMAEVTLTQIGHHHGGDDV
jgi:CDP-glucose 4,6-dehydratase